MKLRQMMRSVPSHIVLVSFFVGFAAGARQEQESSALKGAASDLANALDGQAANGKVTPVTRVVGLLEEMKTTLETEMEDDKKLYGKMECWCHNNKYTLETAIEDGTNKANKFRTQCGMFTAQSSNLASVIQGLTEKGGSALESLRELTTMRTKEREEFQAFEKMSIESIEQLKAAILVLSRHSAGASFADVSLPQIAFSFLERTSVLHKSANKDTISQGKSKHLSQHRSKGRKGKRDDPDLGMQSDAEHALEVFTDDGSESEEKDAVEETPSSPPPAQGGFLEKTTVKDADRVPEKTNVNVVAQQQTVAHADPLGGWTNDELMTIRRALRVGSSFVQSKHKGSYVPNYEGSSFEILGMLKQMKADMEDDLVAAQTKEKRAQELFVKLRKAKLDEIAIAEALEAQNKDDKAKTDNDLIWAQNDLDDTLAALAADQESLRRVTKKCSDEEAAFEKRKVDRTDEMTAVSETIDILTGDDARDAMNIAYKASGQKAASFLQLTSEERDHKARRQKLSAFLRTVALRTHSPELAFLASKAQLDKFELVNIMMDKMIKSLKEEQESEVKKNDWCTEELHQNEKKTLELQNDKKGHEALIASYEEDLKELELTLSSLNKKVADLTTSLKEATAQRAEEKASYNEISANQLMTKQVLQKALNRLGQFYNKAASLQQVSPYTTPTFTTPVPATDVSAPAPDQMEYKPHSGAAGVFAMMEKLIADIEKEMQDDAKEESDAVADFAAFKENTEKSIYDSNREISRKIRSKAWTTKMLLQTKGDLKDTNADLEDMAKFNEATLDECQFYMDNFNMRQQARQDEIEALQQAKQILSGASIAS